jgi:chlorobactene lauroyltransferase
MLTANKSKMFEKVFGVYNRNLIKRRFQTLSVMGLSEFSRRNENLPLIIYANHSSWWDGLLAFEISRKMKLDSFIMMEEKQLKKLFFFRRLGAFSIARENPRLAMQSIVYAAQILRENCKSTLWIFPQGKIFPNDLRPLYFYKGLTKIIEKTGTKVQVMPVAFRYEFIGDFKPVGLISIGKIETIQASTNFHSNTIIQKLCDNLTGILDKLKSTSIKSDFVNFENLY